METIEPLLLKQMINTKVDFVLIDVRERHEHLEFNIGGIFMPLKTVLKNIASIPIDKPVVFYCAKGLRSAIAIEQLEYKNKKYTNLINLSGGIKNWKYYFYGNSEL